MNQIKALTERTLAKLAAALNGNGVQRGDIQFIIPENGKYTALYWATVHNGTFHAIYLDADGEWQVEHTSFKDFYNGDLPTGTCEKALETAIMHWQDQFLNEDGNIEIAKYGWDEFSDSPRTKVPDNPFWDELPKKDGCPLIGTYWVEIDD